MAAEDCARCGVPRERHWSVNFSDGPHVGGEVLVCPTATFTSHQCCCLDCRTLDFTGGRADYEDGVRCMACAQVFALKNQEAKP